MPVLVEGNLTFTFPDPWEGSKYDDWSHYRNQFIKVRSGIKAVDLIAVERATCCWLIEVKDYRTNRRTKTIDLADEVAGKVIDTLAGLVSAQVHANDEEERRIARRALRAGNLRVVLHLEQPPKPSKFFPARIVPSTVAVRLAKRIKAIDPHPLVVEMATNDLPWTVH